MRVRRPEKPWWMRAVSIFGKNFLLLMAIAGLIQLVRKVAVKSEWHGGSGEGSSGVWMSHLEGRRVRMLQVQVEVVDTKLESEIGRLRKEFDKKIGEKDAILERELGNLVEREGENWLSTES